MPSPPIQLFLTTIASAPQLRQKQEYLLRILQVKKISFTSFDLASPESEDAKRLWRRKAPANDQALPGILIGGKWPGNFAAFEEAVEFGELDQFLRLSESWNEADGDWHATPVERPVGVPGAFAPLQMNPEQKPTIFAPTAPIDKSELRNRADKEFDVSTELSGYGLQGVRVTEDDLAKLVEELGLGGDDADDLVKGLGGGSKGEKKKEATPEAPKPPKVEEKKPVAAAEEVAKSETSAKKEEPTAPQPTEKTIAKPTKAEPAKEEPAKEEAPPAKDEAAKEDAIPKKEEAAESK